MTPRQRRSNSVPLILGRTFHKRSPTISALGAPRIASAALLEAVKRQLRSKAKKASPMPSSSASTRDSWSEPLALEIFRISDVGAILQETVPSVSMTSTTHNNHRVSMATFYGRSHLHPLPTGPGPGKARPGGAAVATPPAAIDFPPKPGL